MCFLLTTGDGRQDLVIGTNDYNGKVFVVYSRAADQPFPSTLLADDITAQGSEWGILLPGNIPIGMRVGYSVAGVGGKWILGGGVFSRRLFLRI